MLVALAVIVEVMAVGMQDVEMRLRPCDGDGEQPPLSSIPAADSVARSDGMLALAACRTKTDSHSSPLAEWMVLRMR